MSSMDGDDKKGGERLPVWRDEKTMNLDTVLLNSIRSSAYFKDL